MASERTITYAVIAALSLAVAFLAGQSSSVAQGPSLELSAPPGTMAAYGGPDAPPGWLLANGDAVSRTQYAALFAAIQTTYGAGNGTTTFNLPDLRGRVPVGADDDVADRLDENDQLGQSGGEEKHTLTTGEMPSHTHAQDSHSHTSQDAGNHRHTLGEVGYLSVTAGPYGVIATNWSQTYPTQYAGDHHHTINPTTATNQNTGAGNPHYNMQPFQIANYIIKT